MTPGEKRDFRSSVSYSIPGFSSAPSLNYKSTILYTKSTGGFSKSASNLAGRFTKSAIQLVDALNWLLVAK